MGKRLVSGLTLLFLEEAQKHQENSGSIGNGGAMLENSVITDTKKDVESVVERGEKHIETTKEDAECCFLMPLHYPLVTKKDYEDMSEWKLDQLLLSMG
ncbi:Uncharacterized protein TCM_005698 [Theobroma cacao]|uniref:DUF7722 domain-containing protein n=1 Tax=Theobroma cacao TaxID=3641 RepID=A0A061DVL3_THECC|nr:Uncharacterized protein TCM_005698 [Theobroma cacao]